MKNFDIDNPQFRVVLWYPLQAIHDIPPSGWLTGLVVGMLQWVTAKWLLCLALASAIAFGFIDQRAGEHLARCRGEYDPMKADAGMYGKILGFVLVGAVWVFETILVGFGAPDFNGAAATATAAWLAWHEVESIHLKYVASGRPPIIIISQINALLKRLTSAIFPAPQTQTATVVRDPVDGTEDTKRVEQ